MEYVHACRYQIYIPFKENRIESTSRKYLIPFLTLPPNPPSPHPAPPPHKGLTCKVDPTLLVSCVRRLLSSTPLLRHDTILVNTQGWVKSLGLVVLGEVLDAVGVDRVIKIGGVEGVDGMVIEKNEMAKEKRDTITDTER